MKNTDETRGNDSQIVKEDPKMYDRFQLYARNLTV